MIRDAWRQRSVRPSDRRQPERCSGSDADGTKRLTSFSTDRPFAFRLYTIGQRLCPRDRVPKHSPQAVLFTFGRMDLRLTLSATKIDSSGYETDISARARNSPSHPPDIRLVSNFSGLDLDGNPPLKLSAFFLSLLCRFFCFTPSVRLCLIAISK